MFKKSRPDGTYISNLSHFVRMQPYLMPSRNNASIYFEQEFDITHTIGFLGKFNRGLAKGIRKISFFQIFMCAAVRTIAVRPKMNRFVSGYNYYQRNQIVFNFVAKKELNDQGEEINVTIPFSPYETLETLPAKTNAVVEESLRGAGTEADKTNELLMRFPRWAIRLSVGFIKFLDFHNMLPASMIKTLPFYSTVFFTNVGSIGVDAPYHHQFEFGTCGLFIALGKVRRERILGENGQVQFRDLVKVIITFDDRICDGMYAGKSIALFRYFTENPEELLRPVELKPEILAEHQFKTSTLIAAL